MGSVKVTSLNPGEQYYAQVRALDDEGVSTEWSKTYRFTAGDSGGSGEGSLIGCSWTELTYPNIGEFSATWSDSSPPGTTWVIQTQVFLISEIESELGSVPNGENSIEVATTPIQTSYNSGLHLISLAHLELLAANATVRARSESQGGIYGPWFWPS